LAGPIELTNADFIEIKTALIEYLESTAKFPGLNFEGSNIQVILDVLAYQQQLNAYVANMVANESSLESAVIRKNVVSQAKNIGYNPVSARCSKSVIDFKVELPLSVYPSGLPNTVTLEPGISFATNTKKNNFIFNVIDPQVAPVRNDGIVEFKDIEVYEGVYLNDNYLVDSSKYEQRFVIRNKNVDTTSLRVEVQENPNEDVRTYYTQADNLVELTEESRKYWIEETANGYYELIFGDGLFGYKPVDGAKIFVTYVISSGGLANGIQSYTNYNFVGKLIDSYGIRVVENITVESAATSFGGADIESIASIKYRGPRLHAAQNRCVIAEDYDVLIRKIFPPVQDIYVYGGETLEVPEFGRVYVAIKPTTGNSLSNSSKAYIKKSLEPYRVASLDINLIDPDLLFVEIDTAVYYDEKKSIKDNQAIRATVIDALNRYVESTAIPKFGGALRYSRIVSVVDDADVAITRNNTTLTMRKDVSIVPNTFATYQTSFKQEIDIDRDRSVVYSTGFFLELEGQLDERTFYFENDPNTIRTQVVDDDERIISDLYCFYFNEFGEKKRVSFYRNKFDELIVKDVLSDDEDATPFGMMSFRGEVEIGLRFDNGIKFVQTVETGNFIQIRAVPKNLDIFVEESVFLQMDVSMSTIAATPDTKIGGS